jgi:ABC-type transport system substrate-binding protein
MNRPMKITMKDVARRLALLVAAGLVLGTQTVLSVGGAGAASSGGGVLTVGYPLASGINPIEFDPVQYNGPAGFFAYNWPIYAGLLRETPGGTYVPDLASKVTIPNPTTINITVRSGLVYSNGAPLTAAGVKAGFERNLSNPSPAAWDSSMYDITSIDVTGPTVVLHFSQPVASTFYPLLADQEGFMALPTGASGGPVNLNVVGAGPFKLQTYTAGGKIVLVKNPKYWDAKNIKLAGITFPSVPEGPQELNALESGTSEVQVALPPSDIPTLKHLSGVKSYSTFPDANYYFAPLCSTKGPLANLKVRQALSYATNRKAINQSLLFGEGQPAWSIFPSTSALYEKSLTNSYAYNVKKAKQLLAQAGYAKGFSTSIMALPEPVMDQLATVLQDEWKQIGVKLTIVPTTNYVTDLYRLNKAQIGLNPQGLPGLGKLTTQYLPGTTGDLCNYKNPTLINLINQLQALPPTSPKLPAVWSQIQKIIINNVLSIYIDFAPLVTGASNKVHNVQIIPYVGGVLNYWTATVSS